MNAFEFIGLALYHVSAEEKFENGGPADVGPAVRRNFRISRVGLIGKEADKVGEVGEEDRESEAVVEFSIFVDSAANSETA